MKLLRLACYFAAGLNVPLAAFSAWGGRWTDFGIAIGSGALLTWVATDIGHRKK